MTTSTDIHGHQHNHEPCPVCASIEGTETLTVSMTVYAGGDVHVEPGVDSKGHRLDEGQALELLAQLSADLLAQYRSRQA